MCIQPSLLVLEQRLRSKQIYCPKTFFLLVNIQFLHLKSSDGSVMISLSAESVKYLQTIKSEENQTCDKHTIF